MSTPPNQLSPTSRGISADPLPRQAGVLEETVAVERLALVPESEGARAAEERDRAEARVPGDWCVHELFEAQAERTPDAVAVTFGGRSLAYRELDARANRLANHLVGLGVGPEARVGICLERGLEPLVCILGVMKAGGAWVPVDPGHPAERKGYVFSDSGVTVILTQARLAPGIPDLPGVRVIAVDGEWERIAAEEATAPETSVTAQDLAYVIYTSGSTGRPKGVAMHHRGVVNYIDWGIGFYGSDRGNGSPVFSSLAVDLTITNLLPLFAGKPAHFLSEENAVEALAAALRERPGYGAVKITPVHLTLLTPLLTADEAREAAHTLVIGADFLPAEPTVFWQDHAPGVRLMNEYGPTETVVGCSAYVLPNGVHRAGPVPVGGPMRNAAFHVLDEAMEAVAPGLPGELYIGGAGVARGYLGRPALTAERFVPDPFAGAGARMYRSGDRARWVEDGNLMILGRTDGQVKIRGYRVELGEIETVLRRHPSVTGCLVVVREDRPGDRRLVAYVAATGPGADASALRAHLLRSVPEYMVPDAFVVMDALPRTATGKLDPRVLPAPVYGTEGAPEHLPRTPREEALAGIWRDVLGADAVDVETPFLELGGNSLAAFRVLARISDAFGVALPARALLGAGSIREVAALLDGEGGAPAPELPPLVPGPHDGPLPLTLAQEAVWFFEQMAPGMVAYRAQSSVRLRGPVDVPAMEAALTEIVRRHEIFRTTFPVENGGPVQRVQAPWPVRLRVHDVSAVEPARLEAAVDERVMEEFLRPCHVAALPLVWWSLVRRAPEDHVLTVVEHHFVHDGWSFGVFIRELHALYVANLEGRPSPLPEPVLQFADFAVWQRRWLESDVAREQLAFWEAELAGVPPLEMPTDFPRPAVSRFRGARERVRLPAALVRRARAFGHAQGVTLFTTLLAAYQALLGRYSGQTDFCVGSGLGNRRHHVALEGVIGMVVNTVGLRADLHGDPTGAELLRRVRECTLRAYEHQEMPFDRVVRHLQPERSASTLPIYQVAFSFHDSPMTELAFAGLRLELTEAQDNGSAKHDFQITVMPRLEQGMAELADEVVMLWEFDTDLYTRATIQRMAAHYETLLEALVADPARRLSELPLLREEERRRVVEEWNRTDAPRADGRSVHELFAEHAARTPNAVAVADSTRTLTYGELDRRAAGVARALRAHGVGPEVRVGVCLERGVELVAAWLGVLRAGGAYVPLDPRYPAERLAYILADSGAAVLLTEASLRAALPAPAGVRVVEVGADDARPDGGGAPEPGATAANLAYVVYTSGSTGRPKGVAVTHGALAGLCAWHADAFAVTAADRATQLASPAFDAAGWEVWPYLSRGASVRVAPEEVRTDPAGLRDWLLGSRATLAFVPTPLAGPLLELEWPADAALRAVLTGGDRLQARPRAGLPFRLSNNYGPTECTVVATSAWVAADGAGPPPIGGPIHDTRCYVLDPALRPQPVRVPGELFLGGAQVARGYLGRPALTAERFVPDPFGAPGGRLYRTGDRVRWLADGTLEYLGRLDEQVKIRGYRIELGEIEARLREHAAVRDAVVTVRRDAPGEPRLAAYWVGEGDVEVQALRGHLLEQLPDYMVPAAYVRLEQLPLTPNGKLDHRALPAPEGEAYAAREYQAPEGGTEQALAGIWAELLGVERVGRGDHFFELGGHSLLAMQVISRVRQALGAEVALAGVFTRPVLADFARALETAARPELPPVEPTPREGRLPLSFAQQGLWFVERLGEVGGAYHIHRRLRLRGELDRAALARALDGVVARHEALRTTFAQVDGVPEQRIAPADTGFHLVEHHLEGRADADAELGRRMAEEAGAPFDLERGPLIRGGLVRLAADDHVLLLTMHHIVSDGWSMGVLFDELSALYAAHVQGREAALPALPVQYADYAAWQRRWVKGEVLQAQADYWKEALAGVPELLALPTDRPRAARMDPSGARLEVELDEALTAGLMALSRRQGTTLFMTLLAGWAVVLGRLSGHDDVVIGTPVSGRGRREIEGLIGFFVNTLALRVDLSDAPTAAELLARVKERALAAQQNQDIPFEQVVELAAPVRSLSHAPLVQVTFAWQNTHRGAAAGLSLPGVQAGAVGAGPPHAGAKGDLWLVLGEADGRIVGSVTYAAALFEAETVERHLGYLRRVLEEMAADESRPVERLALMSESERSRVLEAWNRTEAAYPAESCIHELFERQVERAPDAEALVFGDERLGYGELNRRANRLAHHLRALGVGPDARVAICIDRGPEMIVALLAVLKAGGAYVPLDPSYPAERLDFMLADSAPAAVLTRTHLRDRFEGTGVTVLDLDSAAPEWADRPATDPERGALTPEHLAYVIYTSGSTGRPKGVLVPHRGLSNVAAAQQRAFGVGAGDRVLQFASPSFDAATFEVTMALASGAALCLAPREELLPGPGLLALLRRHAVTLVTLPPSALAALPVEDLPALRTITVAGEALPAELAERWGARHRLWNLYGPTEATIWSTAAEVADPARKPDIGGPVANVRAHVLDGGMEPHPVGVVGELYVGGAGVARGYLGRPALTAERFVPDPFGGEPGARLYRTGDRVRRRADGALDFLGRVDHQVKVRGYRIELGEIEARLREHPGVREAVVAVREDTPGDRRLAAYVVGGETAGADVLRAHLGETLPEYMVPAAYLRLDALPLTPSGKLDRGALPAPEGDAYQRRAYEAPVGEAEEMLAQVWSEVLGVERVGRHDDFFELGGHSLLMVQVISLLEAEIDMGEMFTRPVLHDFARALEKAGRAELPPIDPAPREGRLPLSFAQQRLWFLEQMGNLGGTYHIPLRLRLRGGLDRAALARALDGIVARHQALRTVFPTVDGVPEQRIAPDAGFHLVEHDLDGRADAKAELERLMDEEAGAPFDLARGPLIRGRLIRLGADDHVLLLTMHHIVSDGWSMGVFTRELSALYAAHARGREADLPALPVQYADYAAWQRRWVEGEVLQAQADYWTRTLSGAPELLALPTDRPRPARMDHAGARLEVVLDEALTAGLKALSRRHGTTLFMTLLAGWATVLGRLAGEDDVVLGTPSANRGRREVDELIGLFVNTLALRVDLSGAPTVAELLGRVKKRALDAQRHQDIPFEQVVELVRPARTLAHTPVFQVMFAWRGPANDELALPGLGLEPVGAAPRVTAKFDLMLGLAESGGRITGGLEYATALFERDTVERWLGYLRRALHAMAAGGDAHADRLPMLAEAERRQVVEGWNATDADYPADACVHELVAARAARTPGAEALAFEGGTMSYGELNARANRLAHFLAERGVGPDVRVGVCVERGPEMVVGLLAAIKAGGAYVPLDPEYPGEQLRYMLEDSAPAVLLTRSALRNRFEGLEIPVFSLDADADRWSDRPAADPARGALTPRHLMYVIYTSGSTGRPKGVMAAHRGVVNRLLWMQDAYALGADDAVLQKTSHAFDVSVWELFWTLGMGARLVLARPGGHRDPAYLAEVIRREGVTRLHFVPSMLQPFLEEAGAGDCASVTQVVCSGEALPPALVKRFHERLPNAWLDNLYGPTEASVDVTAWRCAPADAQRVRTPLGGPIANTRIYVLDARGEPVPVGVAGELYIGGVQVARGYLGRPALTAERFVADPFGSEPGARLYRTGDLARRLGDGTLEYLGRNDFQVKIRGFRVELGGIEARLAEHPEVREAAVVAREEPSGDRRLAAYYLAGSAVPAEALRAHLGETLPEYMVPAAFVHLPAWPLTPTGKLDRGALPAPEGDAFATRGYEAPEGEIEEALAEIWAELLGVERVGRSDDFFQLGGHSLLAARVVSRVRQAMEVELGVGAVFERPALWALADRILDLQLTRFDPETLARLAPLVRGEDAGTAAAMEARG